MIDPQAFVGQQIKLAVTLHETKYGTIKSYTIDDPDMQRKLLACSAGIVRILIPGSMWTADYNAGRLNFHVAEDGTITEASYG